MVHYSEYSNANLSGSISAPMREWRKQKLKQESHTSDFEDRHRVVGHHELNMAPFQWYNSYRVLSLNSSEH